MKKILWALAAALTISANAWAMDKPVKATGFDHPESVTSDGEYFYASNIGESGDPMAKDHNGYISRLAKDGKVVDKKYLPKEGFLDAPKGLVAAGGILFAADIDRVVGYDVKTGKEVFNMSFAAEGTKLLNGMAAKDDKTVFVSAMDTNKIYEIDVAKVSFKMIADDVVSPNGMSYDPLSKKLYVVCYVPAKKGSGKIGVVDLSGAKPAYKVISDYAGDMDGAKYIGGGRLAFSDWMTAKKDGVLKIVDVNTGKVSDLALSEKISGPADFYFDSATGVFWIPMMMENSVLIEKPKL